MTLPTDWRQLPSHTLECFIEHPSILDHEIDAVLAELAVRDAAAHLLLTQIEMCNE